MKSENGSALIVVLLTIGFLSFISVLFVQYTLWQTKIRTIPRESISVDQGLKYARSQIHDFFKNNLSDTGFLETPRELEWERKPSLTIRARIISLNAKLNLNTLIKSRNSDIEDFLTTILEELNYPNRTVDELQKWIDVDDDKNLTPRYTGYGYRPPRRKLYHMDEVSLVSGFIQVGVSEAFREIFTVYGTGKFNPLHLNAKQWDFLRSVSKKKLPKLPERFQDKGSGFREFLKQDPVWNKIEQTYPFMTRRDDSFQVEYFIEAGNTQRVIRSIYVYKYLTDTLKIRSRYTVFKNWNNASKETKLKIF